MLWHALQMTAQLDCLRPQVLLSLASTVFHCLAWTSPGPHTNVLYQSLLTFFVLFPLALCGLRGCKNRAHSVS